MKFGLQEMLHVPHASPMCMEMGWRIKPPPALRIIQACSRAWHVTSMRAPLAAPCLNAKKFSLGGSGRLERGQTWSSRVKDKVTGSSRTGVGLILLTHVWLV